MVAVIESVNREVSCCTFCGNQPGGQNNFLITERSYVLTPGIANCPALIVNPPSHGIFDKLPGMTPVHVGAVITTGYVAADGRFGEQTVPVIDGCN